MSSEIKYCLEHWKEICGYLNTQLSGLVRKTKDVCSLSWEDYRNEYSKELRFNINPVFLNRLSYFSCFPFFIPSAFKYSLPVLSLNNRKRFIQFSSSTAVTRSVFFTLWIHGTCLSPIPSIRCPPNPFISSVGHCRASEATILMCGYAALISGATTLNIWL